MRNALLSLLVLAACTKESVGDDTGSSGDTDTGGVDEGPQPAPLATLSSGACPDLTTSGTSTFQSSGLDRQVTVVIPSNPGTAMPVNFFFHGLTDPSYTLNPGGDTADGLGLQAIADETNSIWILPDSQVQNLFGIYEVYLWDLAMESEADLVLFDDLRTCAANTFDVDLHRVNALGFSGGALFTTLIATRRSDTLASAVELSGGSDLSVPGYEVLLSAYQTPAMPIPVLLTTGGANDVWPQPTMVIVDFEAASDTFQGELLTDGHYVVRCKDDRGHSMNNKDWNIAQDWVAAHTFGEPSPYLTGGLGGDDDWCEVAAPAGQ